MKKEETALIIPIRMHSSRLPGKFHKVIGNKPMICHVLDKATQTGIKHIYVAVDHLDHFNLIEQYGGKAILTSSHHQSGTDRVFEAYQKIQNKDSIKYIINLQGDVPFINPESIVKTLDLLNQDGIDIGTIATKITDESEISDPNIVKIAMNQQNIALYFSRLAIPYNADKYYHHLGVYAFRIEALEKFVQLPMSYLEKAEKLEQLRAMENGMKIAVVETNEAPISVDTEEDFAKAVEYYDNHIKANK